MAYFTVIDTTHEVRAAALKGHIVAGADRNEESV